MSDHLRRRLDVVAGSLLFAGLLTALALVTHDPADLPGTTYPTNPTPHNLLGPAGAALSAGLLGALGVAAFFLLAAWMVLVLTLLVRRRPLAWARRLAGWALLVPSSAVLADAWGEAGPSFPAGAGGSLGAWLALALADHLAETVHLSLVAAVTALACLLAFDFLWRRLARACRAAAARTLRLPRRLLPRPPFGKRRAPAVPIRHIGTAPRAPGPPEAPPEDGESAADADTRTIPIHHHSAPSLSAEVGVTVPPLTRQGPRPQSEQERFADYELPPLSLLEDPQPLPPGSQDQELRDRAALLEKTCADFGLNVRVVGINTGPVITQFEIALETGLPVRKVKRLDDDISLNLKAASVRIVAPIPGKNTVGIEVPNELRADVRLKEVILASARKIAKSKIPLFLGKDAEGRPLVHDLADMPHLLIAGTTGTGKSVCMNAIILSMLMTRRPDEVKMVLIDPKGGVELEQYGKIPHLMHPVVTDMKKSEAILAWAVDKMEERYDLLRRARVRNLAAFNELPPGEAVRRIDPVDDDERAKVRERMPYIVIFIDEMADLMMQLKKEVEGHIIRLAQKSRAAGIHLVVATQKPTVDVITGLIKSNLPARICFKVSNKSDSRVVLDEMGADKLLGKGDMLFLPPGTSNLVRGQGTYASDAEIQAVVGHLETDNPCYAVELMQLSVRKEDDDRPLGERLRERDKLYEQAVELVIREGRGSTSLLQRALGIGYGRASRLIDFMAEDGIVGGYNGSAAREVLFTPEQWAALRSGPAS
jgi:DNA segregation ATPase FtsK/SpoIIIE, S-DNA-T family